MIVHKKLYGWLSLAFTLLVLGQMASPVAHAQGSDPNVGVLVMEDVAGATTSHSTYYHTGFGWKTLLNATTTTGALGAGEATVEFWVKSTGSSKGYTLADQSGFYLAVDNTGNLTGTINGQNIAATLPYGSGSVETWHHMALVFTGSGTTLTLYHNGQQMGQYTGLSYTPTTNTNLYFFKGPNSSIYLTEMRAWTTARAVNDISFEMYEVYAYNNTGELETRLTSKGLVAYYGDDQVTLNSAQSFMSGLRTPGLGKPPSIHWGSSFTNPGVGNGRATYMVEGAVLVQVRVDADHPSAFNDKIILNTTKGVADADGVQLKWLPQKEADQYVVRRNNLLIRTLDDMGNQRERITIKDTDVVPGQLYTYRVSGYSTTDASLAISSNEEEGFVLNNGMVRGTIQSESQVAVDSVAVSGRPSTAHLPGHALVGGVPLRLNNTSQLAGASGATLSFWYKASSSTGTQDSVLVIGTTKVMFNGSTLEVRNVAADGTTTLLESSLVTNLTQWQHYTIVLGGATGQPSLYQNGQPLNIAPITFGGLNGGSAVEFNGVAGAAFTLDELAIWTVARKHWQIAKDWHLMRNLSKEEIDNGLAYYFRFDMGNPNEVYNLLANKAYSEYLAKPKNANHTIGFTAASGQPEGLHIGAFTNTGGNYTIGAINYGGSMSFTLTPTKTNHAFRPASRQEILSVSEDYRQYQKLDVDFTDISQLPVSGRILYTVEVNGTTEEYPVPEGQQITRNGQIAHGDKASTDRFGQYLISAEVGNTTFAPHNPTQTRPFGLQSVFFDGTAYMQSEKTMSLADSATWSFYVNLGTKANTGTQTLWLLGNLRLDVEAGQTLVLYNNGTQVVQSTHLLPLDSWAFVGLSLTNDAATLTVNGQGTAMPGLSNLLAGANGTLYLGAKVQAGASTSQYFTGYLDHLAYRKANYPASKLADLHNEEYIPGDADNALDSTGLPVEDRLQALWAFNEPHTGNIPLRALSIQRGARNYALAHVGTQYSTEVYEDHAQGYRYTYHASNAAYNPQGGTYPNINVVTPLSNMDFENSTRYGISGQVATPLWLQRGPVGRQGGTY